MSESDWEGAIVRVEETSFPPIHSNFSPSPCPSCGEEGWIPMAHLPPTWVVTVCKYCMHAKLFKEE